LVKIEKRIYSPDKSLEEIDEYVETKMQRVYELKEIIYEKLGVHDFVGF